MSLLALLGSDKGWSSCQGLAKAVSCDTGIVRNHTRQGRKQADDMSKTLLAHANHSFSNQQSSWGSLCALVDNKLTIGNTWCSTRVNTGSHVQGCFLKDQSTKFMGQRAWKGNKQNEWIQNIELGVTDARNNK